MKKNDEIKTLWLFHITMKKQRIKIAKDRKNSVVMEW